MDEPSGGSDAPTFSKSSDFLRERPLRFAGTIGGSIGNWFRRMGRTILQFVASIWTYIVLYVLLYLITGSIFYYLELGRSPTYYSWPESIYFSIQVFAGVTFGDVVPTTPEARFLSGIMLLLFVFLLALVITGFGRKAEMVARDEAMGMLGTSMKGHYVVVGSDAVARAATRDLLRQGLNVAMFVEHAEDVERLRQMAPPERLFLTYGPLEHDTLKRLNFESCKAVIVSTQDDAQSLVIALLIQGQIPKTRVIVSANRPELRSTIRKAGITFVASPLEMGGRVCASAAFEPDVAAAVDDLTTVAVGSELEEYLLGPKAPIVGKPFREAVDVVLQRAGAVLIGFSRPDRDGGYRPVLAPDASELLRAGDAIILVARTERRDDLKAWLGVGQGR
jgi:voltage-gated potassium channel